MCSVAHTSGSLFFFFQLLLVNISPFSLFFTCTCYNHQAVSRYVIVFLLCQVRTGYFGGKNRIDSLIADIGSWGATALTIHGRSRQQHYSKLADWDYIYQCARKAPSTLQVLGNGDIFSYLDWNNRKTDSPELSTCMIARGALIKVCI